MPKSVSKSNSLLKAAEAQLRGTTGPLNSPGRPANEVLHDLQVYQIELEMQNETLRQAQIALAESRDRYLDLYDFAPVGYLTLNPAGQITEINLTGASMLGQARGQLLQSHFSRFVAAIDRDRWQRSLAGLRENAGAGNLELLLDRGKGSTLQTRLDCVNVVGAEGLSGLRITLTDISAQKCAEDELRHSEMRWQFAVESNGDAMWDWDAEKDELFLTPAARELFDLPQLESRQAIAVLLAKMSGEERTSLQGQIDSVVSCLTTEWSGEFPLARPGASLRWIATRGRVMTRTADGKPHRVVSISRDITLQKQREDETRKQRELVAHQGRLVLLGELASTLAHEINQPLTAITGFAAGCMRKAAALPDVQELVRAIEEQAMRAGEIAWRMRGFARRQRLGRGALSLHDVIGNVARWIRMDDAHSGIIIDYSGVSADLPMVHADRVELEQVLVNLIRNGIEAGRPNSGEHRIAVAAHPGALPGELEISVTDWGHGLPAVADFDVFQAFSTLKEEGLGLGLTVCKSIIEGHGGRLWASANPQGGTVFRFTLPVAARDLPSRHAADLSA